MSRLIPLDLLKKADLLARAKELDAEVRRLQDEMTRDIPMSVPDSTEPQAEYLPGTNHYRIYIVWTIGTYANGVKHLDIRSVTTHEATAKLHSKILLRDKKDWGDTFERVMIEPRVANHLYGREYREMLVNMGRM